MANYKKRRRPKVKRYRRSFYTREMRLKKGLGIAVLVAVVLLLAWLAAPHVLDWATHTWYTVVRDRDLSASSVASEAAASSAASEAASEAAAASQTAESEPEPVGTAIVEGSWAEVSVSALTSEDGIRAEAQRLAAQGVTYALVTLKDSSGTIYYTSQAAAAANSIAETTVDPQQIASIFKEEGLVPVAALTAFRDPIAARTVRSMAIRYTGQEYLWLDNKASSGGNPWLNPYSEDAVNFIGDLIAEVNAAGFDHVLLEGVQFPSAQNGKQDFGATGSRSRDEQLTADITAWQERFGGTVTLWYGYSLSQTQDSTSTLGVPAWQLGIENLVVEVPSSTTLDAETRTALEQTLTDGGVLHTVFRDETAGSFQ